MINLQTKCNSMDRLSNSDSILIYSGDYEAEKIEVSIVIPTFKRSLLLEETLRSCRNIYQKANFEIVIIFNGRNESESIITLIEEMKINNIRVYENVENIGMFQNWNQGIRLSFGEWISIMHDDDMYEEGFFDFLPDILKTVDKKVAYINFHGDVVTNEKFVETVCKNKTKLTFIRPTLKDTRILGLSPFFATTCGTLMRKSIIEEMGGFDSKTYPSGDVLLPIKLINNGYDCYICKQPVNYYRRLDNASVKKEVMELFIHFYRQLQDTIYADLSKFSNFLYERFKDCLDFKSVWHVFCQAENHGIKLDCEKPDSKISKTLKYKLMDIYQRMYWHFRPIKLTIRNGDGK